MKSAKVCKSGTSESGSPIDGMVAPEPILPTLWFTQTVDWQKSNI
ncbi:hypothetical protein Nos7524_5563 [Nostoc sp. PCC 7524]|nr:hypothetical protein [Nostoc sp. PCC 7524]AFY51274.1 hypothetical protein Nos7524_5563 [Nostoc sp. PCC 7524]